MKPPDTRYLHKRLVLLPISFVFTQINQRILLSITMILNIAINLWSVISAATSKINSAPHNTYNETHKSSNYTFCPLRYVTFRFSVVLDIAIMFVRTIVCVVVVHILLKLKQIYLQSLLCLIGSIWLHFHVCIFC